jgi:hypothetical protein
MKLNLILQMAAAVLVTIGSSRADSAVERYAVEVGDKIEKVDVFDVAGAGESKEPRVYEWTLNILRCFRDRTVSGVGPTEAARE